MLHRDPEQLIYLYVNRGWSLRKLAERFKCSHTAIWKLLREHGIDTSKKGRYRDTHCTNCGTTVRLPVSRIRKSNFCHRVCYRMFHEMGPKAQKRVGYALGIKVPKGVYFHFIDDDWFNCVSTNIMLVSLREHLDIHLGS